MNDKYGKVVAECKSAPTLGAILIIGGGIIAVGMLFGPVRHGTADIQHYILLGVASLLALIGLVYIIKPVTMAVLTEDGMLFYCHKNAALSKEVFIPWENISSLKLVKKQDDFSDSHGRPIYVYRVEATIFNKSELSIPKRMFNSDDSEAIDLDANPVMPAGQDLINIIKSIPKAKFLQQAKRTFIIP